jgi:hypothetical protein
VIDPHWLLQDLDPRTWRAIGRFFLPSQYIAAAQPGEHGLFVLHDGGAPVRAVDTTVGPRSDLAISAPVMDPRDLARELFATGEWDRVHVIDKRHLAHVAMESQATPRRDLTLDAYYHMVYDLIWDGSAGYVVEPPRSPDWHCWTYAGLLEFIARLPSPSALGLCVLEEDGSLHVGLAARVDGGRFTRVTTFEGLPPLRPTVTGSFLEEFVAALDQRLGPAAAVLVCTRSTFETWVVSDDKRAALEAGNAVWQVR